MTVTLRDVIGCARCSRDHRALMFRAFVTPVEVPVNDGVEGYFTFTEWTSCPVTGEPILLRSVEDRTGEESPCL